MAQNASNISGLGGNRMAIWQLTTAYAVLTSYTNNTNCCDLGHIKDSDTKTTPKKTPYESEDGIVRALEETRLLETDVILLEADKAKTDYLAFNTRGLNAVLQYRYVGIRGAKYQEIFALVDRDSLFNLKTPGGADSGKYSATHIAPAVSVTFTAGDLTLLTTPTGITFHCTSATIPANQEYAMMETAVT